MKEEVNDTIKELIAKSLAGETTAAQEQQLQAWLRENEENQTYFEKLRKLTFLIDQRFATAEAKSITINVDAEWNKFLRNTNQQHESELGIGTRKDARNMWLKIAAGLLLLAVATFGINYLLSTSEITTYETANEIKTITLPDGSTVTLNRFSKLSLDEKYSQENRNLQFSGEAFFDVVSSPQLPFVINLKNARIEVVGTSFNVLAYDSIETAEVTVKTGVVKFTASKLKKEIKLSAGEKGSYDEKQETLSSIVNNDVNFMAWSTQDITFEETDLQTIVATLNKVYHANIIIADDVPDSCVVTATFQGQNLESILRVLQSTLNLTYTRQQNSIVISDAGC